MTTAASSPQDIPAPAKPARRKRKWLLILGIIALLIIGLIVGLWWWHNRPIKPTVLSSSEQQALEQKVEAVQERKYEPGEKVIVFTEKEINALFHSNTGQGDKIRFELSRDAVHARIRMDLDEDLPVVGGRKLKAKARFALTDGNDLPALVLEDLTVWGVSIPNAWLGDLKGQNLLTNVGLNLENSRIAQGVESIEVDHGEIRIKLAE